MREIRLTLPLPPSVNTWPRHGLQLHRKKNEYRKMAWARAVTQARPLRDPPARVRVEARFYLRNLRDEDNLKGSLKWAMDALTLKQTGSLRWRQGVYDLCGYLVDDSPDCCRIGRPEQEIDRKNPRLELTITPTDEEW